MDAVERIVALLKSDSPRTRIAAAVVLGELEVRSARVVAALSEMAHDEMPALAEPAVEALGKLGARTSLPVLLQALERKDLAQAASQAIARVGGAVPDSFAKVLEGLRGQPWDAVNKVALSVRQNARAAPPAERKSMARQTAAFVGKLRDDAPALRGAIKILGYLEVPDAAALVQRFLPAGNLPAVRVEAVTALRFLLGRKAQARALRALVGLVQDEDLLVARAARDTLTVVPGVPAADLVRLAGAKDGELAMWAIERLRTIGAARELGALARGADRARAEAAVRALATLPGSAAVLVAALADAEAEAGAHAISEALERVEIGRRELAKLRAAATAMLQKSFAVARRQLEPLRRADPGQWAELLREAARKSKDPARAIAILELLTQSAHASPEDRYAHASLLLRRSALDPHPRARKSDAALVELEKLAASGFAVAAALAKDKEVSDEARHHVGFHFAEHASPEVQAQGVAVLEDVAARGRGRLSRAAKNKLALLRE